MWICCFTDHFVRSGPQVFAKWPAGPNELDHAGLSYSLTHIGHTQSHTKNGYFTLVNALLHIHSGFFSHSVKLRSLPLSAVTVTLHYLPRYLRSTASSNMRQNAYYPNLKWTMVLLRNNDQQQKNPFPSSAMPWTRQKWTASSLLHDTSTVKLALVQCECLTGKWTVIARIKSINRNWAADFTFSKKLFLGPISRGGQMPVSPPCGRPCTCSSHGPDCVGRRKWNKDKCNFLVR